MEPCPKIFSNSVSKYWFTSPKLTFGPIWQHTKNCWCLMQYLPRASYVLHAIPRCRKGKRLGLHPLENYKMNRSGFYCCSIGFFSLPLNVYSESRHSSTLPRPKISEVFWSHLETTQVRKTGEGTLSQANPPSPCFLHWGHQQMCLKRCLWTNWERFIYSNIIYTLPDMPWPFFESSKTNRRY